MAKRTPKPAAKSPSPPPEQEIDPAQISVRLRPIGGIEPTVYVPILWSSALLALIVWLFLLPGTRGPGSMVSFSSSPPGAMVLLDGVRLGATPLRAFVPAGTHTVQSILPDGTTTESRYTVGTRRFGNRLFPREVNHHIELPRPDAVVALDQFLPRFAAWALSGRPSAQFQIPWLAGDFAGLVAADHIAAPVAAHWLRDFLGHANSRPQSADVLRAATIVSKADGTITPASIADVVRLFIHLDNISHGLDRLVAGVIAGTEDTAAAVAIERWTVAAQARRNTELLTVALELDEGTPPIPSTRTLALARYASIPGGNYISDYPLREETTVGVPLRIAPFWISTQLITRADFLTFLVDNDRWRPDGRARLHADGLTGPDYLSDWDLISWKETLTNYQIDRSLPLGAWWREPVTGISWNAANAYAAWFSTRHGVSARLPSSIEWEYAAFWNESASLGLRDLGGTVWEWTATWYSAHPFLYGTDAPRNGDFRVVAGGPTRGRANAVSHTSKGALPPEWSPQTVGFRLVLESP